MTSHYGDQTIPTHILPNIPRIKGNQTMKCGQFLEYNMRNRQRNNTIKIENIPGSIV